MFKIITNDEFIEKEENITYTGRQLKFLGIPIAPKYYLSSAEMLKNGQTKKREYFYGKKNYIKMEGFFDKGYAVGTFSYFKNIDMGLGFKPILSKVEEYNTKGMLNSQTIYSFDGKKIYYYDFIGCLCCEETYHKEDLTFRETKKNTSNVYEIFSPQKNDAKLYVLRMTDKNYDCLSEIRELKNANGELISKKTYKPTSINGLFFMEEEKEGKKSYMLVNREVAPEAYKTDVDFYIDTPVSPFLRSKKLIYKIFSEILAIKKDNDNLRQKAIFHIRKASTLNDKKNIVLAFRTMEKIR